MSTKSKKGLSLAMMMILSACSQKSLPSNSQCEALPIFTKEDFRWVKKNTPLVNKLKQTKAIKDCSCLEPNEQETCFKKFID